MATCLNDRSISICRLLTSATANVFGVDELHTRKMSLKTVGTALTRTLWSGGNRTPPLARSPKVNRLSSKCSAPAGGKQGSEESCSSNSARPSGDVPSTSEPPPTAKAAARKRHEEPAGAPGVTRVRRHSFASPAAPVDQRTYLRARYSEMKRLVHGKTRATVMLCCVSRCRYTS